MTLCVFISSLLQRMMSVSFSKWSIKMKGFTWVDKKVFNQSKGIDNKTGRWDADILSHLGNYKLYLAHIGCHAFNRYMCCYLSKFRRNLQVCSFNGLSVCTCQNFQFWQVCSCDGLLVCLCACVSVCLSVSSSIQVTVFYISLPSLTKVCIYATWPCL